MSPIEQRPYSEYTRFTDSDMLQRSAALLKTMNTRRSVRDFSTDKVDRQVVEDCLKIAATAPSGANQQPWTFVMVESAEARKQVRQAAEAEERSFYSGRAPEEWLDAIEPFGTDECKQFLDDAPVVIAIFAHRWQEDASDNRQKTYYASESVGIATGFLISALHQCGLVSLTHTPSPLGFLNRILHRPDNERPYLLLVAGYPAENCQVPKITKRPFEDVVIRA
jgi:iodotyrosine deiodinase